MNAFLDQVRGKESEFLAFQFAQRSSQKQVLASFHSFERANFYRLMQTPGQIDSQEFDLILVVKESKAVVHIEVASGNNCKNIEHKCKHLEKGRKFMTEVFNHLGILEDHAWKWIPFVAVAEAKNKEDIVDIDKCHPQDIECIKKHLLTRDELLQGDLNDVLPSTFIETKADDVEDFITLVK